ncbi:hypothetical protein [Enterococcus asini]|uniref:hypothetical protein n=1 Tax=Enterococcus asini TaxID=57732 RepID=UPI00241D5017|nr:hypothetical protein [Enterococcus asini]
MENLRKITSKNNDIFLFIDIPDERRNNLGIASGESVLLSIYDSDSFQYTQDINLIRYASIQSSASPTDKEIEFFELVKEAGELNYKKTLVNEYGITNYIRYSPKLTFKQVAMDNHIVITGTLKNANTKSIHSFEIPTISIENETIHLNDNLQFEYILPVSTKVDKVEFKLDLPKQVLTRGYKLK